MVATMQVPDISRVYAVGAGDAYENRELPYSPGQVVEGRNGTMYRFILCADLALAIGDLVVFTTAEDLISVSADISGGTAVLDRPAGVALAVIPIADYGWIQARGEGEVNIVTDGGIAAGNMLKLAVADGEAETFVDGTDGSSLSFGVARAADTATALAAAEYDLDCVVHGAPAPIA